jgi:hypothetical protein
VPVIDPRHRVVNFRLSDSEYETVRTASIAEGARSVSEFARSSVLQRLAGTDTERHRLTESMETLAQKFMELEANVGEIARWIRGPENPESVVERISETATLLRAELQEIRKQIGLA